METEKRENTETEKRQWYVLGQLARGTWCGPLMSRQSAVAAAVTLSRLPQNKTVRIIKAFHGWTSI